MGIRGKGYFNAGYDLTVGIDGEKGFIRPQARDAKIRYARST
jgi:hypothetical protein